MFPKQPASADDLLNYIKEQKSKDIQWRKGRAFCLVYHPGEEREQLIKTVFNQYFSDNALNPTATPSLAELENETVSMCADLFSGDADVCGNITSGGTESILLAVKTARDYFRKQRPDVLAPNVVLPVSAHPAFMKAFQYFGLAYKTVALKSDCSVDVSQMEQAIDSSTIMLVGSAPAYPHGVMDDIHSIAALATKYKVLCHVDACIGGFMLPFVKALGYTVPDFDFAVPGVTSLSADLHKYGYAPKGSSVLLYRNHDLRKHQFSLYTKWNGGVYGSPTMLGTRSGGSIAGAWAAVKSIGYEGYLDMARATMHATEDLKKVIEKCSDLQLMGNPCMSIVAFKSDTIDVFMLADELNKKGWHFERQQLPACLHFTLNYIHRDIVREFENDLIESITTVKANKLSGLTNKLQAGLVKGLSMILPEGTIASIQQKSSPDLQNESKAAMYGMMGALAGTNDLDTIVLDFLDKIYTPKKG